MILVAAIVLPVLQLYGYLPEATGTEAAFVILAAVVTHALLANTDSALVLVFTALAVTLVAVGVVPSIGGAPLAAAPLVVAAANARLRIFPHQ